MRIFRFPAVSRLARALAPLGLTLLSMTGCASLDSVPGGSAAPGSSTAPSPPPPSPAPFPTQSNDLGPRLITPATGGPPVLGLPLGGNIFQPVTGGPPVFGIPLFP